MGMAASQARFLGLTARKNNVEFEGQQINQQRTTLSNQSANYYNDLLGMSVPTPPSVDSYTKTVYTFNDGALTNTITALIYDTAANNGTFKVSYLQQYEDEFTPVSAATSVVTENDGKYYVGSSELRKLGSVDDYDTDKDPYLSELGDTADLMAEEAAYEALLDDKYGDDTWYVRYVQNSSTGVWQPYFYKESDLVGADKDINGNITSAVNCYTMGSDTKTVEVKNVGGCRIEKDSTGRYIAITIPDEGGHEVTYSLTTTTVTDQDAYDDAMNQYEYDKYLYDQAIQEINAQIEIIQAQDKNLELRLKQLDTEQNAISTEMDAVEKVIEKNTESSFKTFG